MECGDIPEGSHYAEQIRDRIKGAAQLECCDLLEEGTDCPTAVEHREIVPSKVDSKDETPEVGKAR